MHDNSDFTHIIQQCEKAYPILIILQQHLNILVDNNYLLSSELDNIIALLQQLHPWQDGFDKQAYAIHYRDVLIEAIGRLNIFLLKISTLKLNDASLQAIAAISELHEKVIDILR
ncbi:MAG: hypothetical protein A3F46_09670 [Legionellales bacterium RIFCSPHIGHO2_12_FULL_42_9]|nr:MAG: hypothetical protein A3F46_09670 [Legionellales bacterium RIFCSPHIGHO2_12_FULL_42_9]